MNRRKANKMAISAAANRLLPGQRVLVFSNELSLAGRIMGWQTDNMLPSDDLAIWPLMSLEALRACRGISPLRMAIFLFLHPTGIFGEQRGLYLAGLFSWATPRPSEDKEEEHHVELDLRARTTSIAHVPIKQVLVQAKATRQKRCKMQTQTQGRRHEEVEAGSSHHSVTPHLRPQTVGRPTSAPDWLTRSPLACSCQTIPVQSDHIETYLLPVHLSVRSLHRGISILIDHGRHRLQSALIGRMGI
ncbi:hypothetical protein GE09DRAFT_155681 [Coniochaeta sp. 2T2.1]|nr:hypothetical protein GE09DRAFT_155681 [Coniochaeta sp. 2T2.1]